MKKIILGALASVAVLAAPAAASAAELVTNGGFESSDFTGWTLGSNASYDSVHISPSAFVPIGASGLGTYTALLGAVNGTNMLSQTLNTVAGDTYTVSFELGTQGNIENQKPSNYFLATIGGVTILKEVDAIPSIYAFGPSTFYGFSYFPSTFKATGSSTLLQFTYENGPGFFNLDNVSVQGTPGVTVGGAVPEPATWALMLVGFGMVGAAMRQRKLVRRTNVAAA